MTANRYLHPADERAARVNKPSVSYKWSGLDPEIVRRCEMHDELADALRPFVEAYNKAADHIGDSDLYGEQPRSVHVSLFDCRRAARVLAEIERGGV